MTDDEIRALLDAATPGLWLADGEPWNRIVWSSADNRICFMAHSNGLDDARDIATSNLVAAAPALANAALEARAERDEAKEFLHKALCEHLDTMAEAAAFRAVLDGVEVQQIDLLPSQGVEHARALGVAIKKATLAVIADRNNLVTEATALRDRLAVVEAERDALVAVKARRSFPILKGEGARIDYQLVADHAEQARKNHYQSIDRLVERGGLSWCELHAVLHNRKWEKMDTNEAMIACRSLEARYLAALQPTPAQKEHSDE